jgi:hypothetical protein
MVTRVPGAGPLDAMSALSARDIYVLAGTITALAGLPQPRPVVLRWNGTRWRATVAQPRLPQDATLSMILAESPTSIWVGGSRPNNQSGTSELARYWNGRSWRPASQRTLATSSDYYLTGAVSDGHGGFLAIGADYPGRFRIWHNVRGRWLAPFTTSADLLQLAAVPGTSSTWAVGVGGPELGAGVILVHGPRPR